MNNQSTRRRTWPIRMRALSFVITFGVVMLECAVVAVPLALGLAITGRFSAQLAPRLVELSTVISLGVAVYAHRSQRSALKLRME